MQGPLIATDHLLYHTLSTAHFCLKALFGVPWQNPILLVLLHVIAFWCCFVFICSISSCCVVVVLSLIALYRLHRMWLRISQKRQTSIQPEGKQATWNESFKLPVHIAETQKLELVLYDHDNIGSDDELGRYSHPVHHCNYCTLNLVSLSVDLAQLA